MKRVFTKIQKVLGWNHKRDYTSGVHTFHSTLQKLISERKFLDAHKMFMQLNPTMIGRLCKNPEDTSELQSTCNTMIGMHLRFNNFAEAHEIIEKVMSINVKPDAKLFNSIIREYFNQKQFYTGYEVVQQMTRFNVKRDTQTFSLIIGYCSIREDLEKFYGEFLKSGLPLTKHILKALINGYTACGMYDDAKMVLSSPDIPMDQYVEIKNELVSALAKNGGVYEAIKIYEEMKQYGQEINTKAVIYLIDNIGFEGQYSRLEGLLKQLQTYENWVHGCEKVISYCIRYKLLSEAVHWIGQIIKQNRPLNEEFEETLLNGYYAQIAEMEDVRLGIDFFQLIKQDIGIPLSRSNFVCLISLCDTAKDPNVYKRFLEDFDAIGLKKIGHDQLNYLWLYKALRGCEEHEKAEEILIKIDDDNEHFDILMSIIEKDSGISTDRNRKIFRRGGPKNLPNEKMRKHGRLDRSLSTSQINGRDRRRFDGPRRSESSSQSQRRDY